MRDEPAGSTHPVSRTSMTIAAFSTVVEWYDFTLYLYLATILSRVFYGGGTASLVVTLGGFAVSYLMRPLGAIVFGQLGDRHGRRRMMLASMALMTVAMLGIALLPTRDAIGPAAGWLLLALRCVMAFSVGGEYTGVVAYLYEGARPERRGLVTSSASAASEVGGLLAVGISATTVSLLPTAALEAWGWRIPFFLGAVLAAMVGIARSTLQESPEFERQRASGSVPANPLRHAVTHHRAAIARGFAISALGSITYYVGIVYVPTFLTTTGAMAEGAALWMSTAAAVMVIAVTPAVGLLSDHVGRKPVLLVACVGAAVLPMTMFAWMAGAGAAALAGALVLAALGGTVSAVGAVATAEQLPGEGRLSGLALGATMATAIFGGLTPLVSHLLLEYTARPTTPGAMIAVVAVAVFPVLWTLRKPAHDPRATG
ncbi:MFS transporter [Sphingomonas sp. Leaf10]|uniref:MFS transporter n=1 Tax=Sphingomonas sp. Leaf10 TaxID=1735676 RepID=UPI0006FA21C2|nr:MFS transporter [Sphingomonas sp. Leaf10]KQM31776.1 MFS transporter [Sphingomonas sp. Leaf10]